ncbi:MAG: purine-binding chemotaxis protein CheW [Candidatus Omnitrophica bacterium]|nr:purine-binding chemotaxis protein CheW [Candidatus Omnitrophota bacterium]
MTKQKDGKIIIELDDQELEEVKKKKEKTIRVLVFSLGGENYCVGIADTKEVIRPPDITRVPMAPEFVVGIINLRGEIISILDIRHFFGLSVKEKTKDMRVIISDVTGSAIGIMADEVKDTIEIEESVIQPPISTLKGRLAEYTKGQTRVGKDILILLDLGKILKCEEIENLRKGE